MSKIDEVLNSLSPDQLAAFEAEVDKIASEQAVDQAGQHYFDTGVKLAQDVVTHFMETGEVAPVLHLAVTPGAEKAADAGTIDAILDKCSAEELAELDRELDEKLAADAVAEEYANSYLQMGIKLAREVHSQITKTGAVKVPAFGEGFLSGAAGKKGTGFGHALGTAFNKSPGLALAGTAGAGMLADRLLDKR